jgi:hypothetical protein
MSRWGNQKIKLKGLKIHLKILNGSVSSESRFETS